MGGAPTLESREVSPTLGTRFSPGALPIASKDVTQTLSKLKGKKVQDHNRRLEHTSFSNRPNKKN
jgi:hypothetical protein